MTPQPSGHEPALAARVLDALLREDYGGLRRHLSADHGVLHLPGGPAVRLERTRPGLLSDVTVAADQRLRLDQVLAALRELADPRDDVASFERECREALAAAHRCGEAHAGVLARLDRLRHADRTADRGPGTFYDVLAAYTHHPVYPTCQARPGLSADDLRRYAPEFHPVFALRWAAVPRRLVTQAGRRPGWWPCPADVGLPGASADELFPVHPLSTRDRAVAPEPYLQVTPTLSMRTVSVGRDPATHLKLPLPTSTLGLRNRRSIVPRTLADGAVVQRLLARILAEDPGLPVLLADEQTYGHAEEEMLGYLVRRFPAATARARVLPVAALLAVAPGGRHVIEELTSDVEEFFGTYLRALFALNVTLFARHRIALETHQQNLSLVLAPDAPLRLLIKDNDGALVPPWLPEAAQLADRRLVTADPEAVARVFVTITLHLCAAAPAFGLAERGLLPLATGLRLVRDRLDEALTAAGRQGAFLRSRTLDADRLPIKAMVTAGTLTDKTRTGAADINKHYGPPGPNYLREIAR